MPSKSKQQQKFMGLVHAYKKGEVPASKVSQAVKDAAKSMKKSSVKKYAKTKHDDLPLKKEERDYKDEYKKFQSSTKSKKYRAELNKYNRKKGTYGNGDGKDASHKGGKIVGFEKESKNRGRAEKSRLKKENLMNKINEEQYFDPNGELKKYMDKVLKQAGIRVIKYDPMKQSFHNGSWGGFYTVKSSNKVDIGGKPVKRGSAVLPVYISRVGEIELGVKAGGFHIGKVGSSQVLKNLKDFKKGDLDEGYSMRDVGLSPFYKKLNSMQRQAVSIALVMGGNMTGAVKAIEKIKKGLSKDKKVKNALKLANESVKEGIGDMMSKKIGKHKGTRNKAEVGNILKYLMKKGDAKKDALDKIEQNYDYVSKKYRSASVSKKAEILTSLQESIDEARQLRVGEAAKKGRWEVYDNETDKIIKVVANAGAATRLMNRLMDSGKYTEVAAKWIGDGKNESIFEGIFGKFDTGAAFKGNGMTVYDRNQEKAGDFKDIAHIAPDGKITIYDSKVKKEPKLMQSLNKISQEFKKTFKESVKEIKLHENPAAMAAAQAMTKIKMKNPKTGKDVSATSALKNKDNPNHKKAKSIFQRLKDKFSKKKDDKPEPKRGSADSPEGRKAAAAAGMNIGSFTREGKLREYIREEIKNLKSVDENILKQIQQAEKIAKSMAGNMTGAVKGIEKIRRGLSHHKRVKIALKKANESINEKMDKRQAGEMLKQLGGNKFIAMTGAKNFTIGPKGVGFKIGRNAKGVNYVRIDLDRGKDLYNMSFDFVSVRGIKNKAKVKGVYNDQLQKMFTKHTGMYTSL